MDRSEVDEVDEVVREIPVYLSTELSDSLHVVQYPLFSIHRAGPDAAPMEPPLPSNARIRARHSKLELGVNIGDQHVPGGVDHYDEPDEEELFSRQQIKEHRYVSSRVPHQTHYAIGAMRDGALHLTPVHRILQMRPSLAHIDQADEADQDQFVDEDGMDQARSASAAGAKKKDVKPTQQAYRKRETQRAMNARLNSWTHLHTQELLDPFVDLAIHPADSGKADDEFEKMFCDASEEAAGAQETGGEAAKGHQEPEWLESLGPGVRDDLMAQVSRTCRTHGFSREAAVLRQVSDLTGAQDPDQAAARASQVLDWFCASKPQDVSPFLGKASYDYLTSHLENGENDQANTTPQSLGGTGADFSSYSLAGLAHLLPEQQVSAILHQARVVEHHLLEAMATNLQSKHGSEADQEAELMRLITPNAVLVRGNWVIRSDFVAAPNMVHNRDALLALICKEGFVVRQPLTEALKPLSESQVLELLEQVAVLNRIQRCWRLKLPDNPTFEQDHPTVTDEQSRLWEKKCKVPSVRGIIQRYEAELAKLGPGEYFPTRETVPMVAARPGF
uniref:DNA-directed RNA polymerase III subunit RPC5 n=1 Tax=Rhizochromulina marina TaxID=1034831 RepID=A0A7S2WQ83_9STRA|mmetsp:Transcript_30016/g.87419  ORF Transcript_30016/g.87419 Transcript_30016/m.87419 type:complete len:561 (+) Transcript_30016:110-1792(+)